jgi:exo-1,4-beta-D-glucosaminidase
MRPGWQRVAGHGSALAAERRAVVAVTTRAWRLRVAGRAAAAAAVATALLSGPPAQAVLVGRAATAGAGATGADAGGRSAAGPGTAGWTSRGSGARQRQPAAALIARADAAFASPSDTGASNVVNLGAAGWRVASSATATQSGAAISQPGFDARSWLPVTNDDAGAPGTEIEALLQNGVCPGDPRLHVNQSSDSRQSVFYSATMKTCYGYMTRIGADTVPRFAVP